MLLSVFSDIRDSDIDFNAEYSDDDEEIRIGEKDLLDYLQKLEENNLFKMNLIQEQQQSLEKIEKDSEAKIQAKELLLRDVQANLEHLEEARQIQFDRYIYYKTVMDATLQDQGMGRSTSNGPQRQLGRSKESNKEAGRASSMSKASESINISSSTYFNQLQKRAPSVFNMHLMSLGASNTESKRINEAINELQKRAGIKTDPNSEKISLLRKIEVKFQKLVEQRMIFAFFDNNTLIKKEKEIKDLISQANYQARAKRA